MAIRTCIYISQRDQGESPPGINAEAVYETLVLPVMEHFPEFRMNPRGYIHETGEISAQLLKEIAEADLVIADLTELSASGYFELGARYAAGLPTVLIGDVDYVMPFNAREFELVRYPFVQSPGIAGDEETIEALVNAIREALDIDPERPSSMRVPMKKTPKERRYELADRIEAAADVIRLIGSNSASRAIVELEAIAEELKSVPDAETPTALREAADRALKVLLQIMDQLATARGSRMAISGTIALIVGGAGWPAVTALGLGLAFWEGKEAFAKALEKFANK
ncbi:MAG: hypothetical protein WD871_12790 [Xanthobacteraceae bacterium]